MVSARPDLNGARIYSPGTCDVWLVFQGMRHRIASPSVYVSLFSDVRGMIALDEIAGILRGPDIDDGACMVRDKSTSELFLIFGSSASSLYSYSIPDLKTFNFYDFNASAVIEVPSIMISAIPRSGEITRV
ncbi:MAG: hypothetical protein ACYDD1_14660 [Caulobacteraceae bacterium]